MDKKTLTLLLLGFGLRLFVIFPGPMESKVEFFANKADLRNYYWPAQTALRGENPYALWAQGQSGEFRADMAPLELAIYVATIALWDDPRAIQVLFAVFDMINIVLLVALLKRSALRLPFQVFYALGPLTVYNLVFVPQDKTILLTLTLVIFYLMLLPEGHSYSIASVRVSPALLAVVAAALLASFKWLSIFYLLPLLWSGSRDLRRMISYGVVFAIVVGLAHLLWFPDWSYVYLFRAGRVEGPLHTSPAVLLNALGLYDKGLLAGLLVISLLTVYALDWFKRIDIFETMALSVMAGVLWTPDMDPVHLSIIVIYFLLIIDWTSPGRTVAVWGLSAWVAAVYAFSTHPGFERHGLPDPRLVTGVYGSPQMILLSYALFVVVLLFYLADKLRGRPLGRQVLQGAE